MHNQPPSARSARLIRAGRDDDGSCAKERASRGKGDASPERRKNSGLQPTSIWLLVAIGVLVAALCFFAMEIWLRSGRSPLVVPFVSAVAPLLMGMFVGWEGWRVRAYQQGKRSLDPLEAGRIFVLTQAGSRAGAVLLGSALGVIVAYGHTGPTSFLAEQMFHLGWAALSSLVLIVVAYMAERWCIVHDDDEDSSGGFLGNHRGSASAPA